MNTTQKRVIGPRTTSPRYVRVYTMLREWISNGKYGPGDKIPTEDEIGQMFSVSRITTRKAIDLLVEDELVYRMHGKGTFVAENVREREGIENIFKRTRTARGIASRSKLADVEVSEIDADARIATDLRIPIGQAVTKIAYVRVFRSEPAAYFEFHIPSDRARITTDNIRSRSILSLIEDQGVTITDAHQLIGATLADPFLASKLGSTVGAPLLTIKQIVMNSREQPVERFIGWFHSEKYEHPSHVTDRDSMNFVQGATTNTNN